VDTVAKTTKKVVHFDLKFPQNGAEMVPKVQEKWPKRCRNGGKF
jgi:hypothetical protein